MIAAAAVFWVFGAGLVSSSFSSSQRLFVPADTFQGAAGRLVPFMVVAAYYWAALWPFRPQRWHPRVPVCSLFSLTRTPSKAALSEGHCSLPPYSLPMFLPLRGWGSFSLALRVDSTTIPPSFFPSFSCRPVWWILGEQCFLLAPWPASGLFLFHLQARLVCGLQETFIVHKIQQIMGKPHV